MGKKENMERLAPTSFGGYMYDTISKIYYPNLSDCTVNVPWLKLGIPGNNDFIVFTNVSMFSQEQLMEVNSYEGDQPIIHSIDTLRKNIHKNAPIWQELAKC